jgi:cytochrome c5
MNDRDFFKVFSGLVAALVAVTVIFFVAAHVIVNSSNLKKVKGGDQAVAARIQPVGQVTVAGAETNNVASGASTVMNALIPTANAAPSAAAGKQVFEGTCVACHGAGVAGAPKFGDKAAWGPRVAKGLPTLEQHALHGFQGKSGFMPPKGGNASLTDDQVKSAVMYMVEHGK